MNVYRLQQLAAALRRCDEYGWEFNIMLYINDKSNCGCAIGLSAIIWPEMYDRRGYWLEHAGNIFGINDRAMEWFGITAKEQQLLFSSISNPAETTAAETADKIDALVAPHLTEPPRMFRAPDHTPERAPKTAVPKPAGE